MVSTGRKTRPELEEKRLAEQQRGGEVPAGAMRKKLANAARAARLALVPAGQLVLQRYVHHGDTKSTEITINYCSSLRLLVTELRIGLQAS